MNLKITAPYYIKIDAEEEIRAAMKHINNVLNQSGIKDNPPIKPVQAVRLKDALEVLRKSLLEH